MGSLHEILRAIRSSTGSVRGRGTSLSDLLCAYGLVTHAPANRHRRIRRRPGLVLAIALGVLGLACSSPSAAVVPRATGQAPRGG